MLARSSYLPICMWLCGLWYRNIYIYACVLPRTRLQLRLPVQQAGRVKVFTILPLPPYKRFSSLILHLSRFPFHEIGHGGLFSLCVEHFAEDVRLHIRISGRKTTAPTQGSESRYSTFAILARCDSNLYAHLYT